MGPRLPIMTSGGISPDFWQPLFLSLSLGSMLIPVPSTEIRALSSVEHAGVEMIPLKSCLLEVDRQQAATAPTALHQYSPPIPIPAIIGFIPMFPIPIPMFIPPPIGIMLFMPPLPPRMPPILPPLIELFIIAPRLKPP